MAPPEIAGLSFKTLIAATALSEVWLAEQPSLGRNVVVKLIRPGRPDTLGLFENERQLLGRLSRHPRIITIYESGFRDSQPYLVLQYADQGSVARLVADGPLDWGDAAQTIDQILEALSFLHGQGIAHGDIKPANLLLDSQAGALLADVALSGVEGSGMTLAYASPERLRGEPASPSSDMYAFGVAMYEMITGELPFDPAAEASVLGFAARVRSVEAPPLPPAATPESVVTLVHRLLSKNPLDRPSVDEARLSLADLDETVRRAVPRAEEPPRRRRYLWIGGAAVAALAIAASTASWLGVVRSGGSEPREADVLATTSLTSLTPTVAQVQPSRPTTVGPGSTIALAADTEPATSADEQLGVALDESGHPIVFQNGSVEMSRIGLDGLTPFAPSPVDGKIWVTASPEDLVGQGSLTILDREGFVLDHTADFGPSDEQGLRLPATPVAGPLVAGDNAYVSYASNQDPTGTAPGGVIALVAGPLHQASDLETPPTVSSPVGTPVFVDSSVFLSYVEPPPPNEITVEWIWGGPGEWDNGVEGPGLLVPRQGGFQYYEVDIEGVPSRTAAGPLVMASTGDFAYVSAGCDGSEGCSFREWPRRGDDYFFFPLDPEESGTVQRVIHAAPDGSLWFVSRERIVTRYDPNRHEVTDVIAAGPCPVSDALTGCRFRDDTSQGLIAFDAFWVPNPGNGKLYRIDLATAKVTDIIDVGGKPGTPSATSDAMWVVDVESATVVRVDPVTLAVTDRVDLPCSRNCDPWEPGIEWRYRPIGHGQILWVPWRGALFRLEWQPASG